MADSSPSAPDDAGATDATDVTADTADATTEPSVDGQDLEALRQEVDEKYDFDEFGPADMAEMNLDEWEAVFDPDSWIVGEALLDRVEADLKQRIANRDVFAVLERVTPQGADEERLVAYSDEGYAIIHPDGSVEGEGTVLRDVKPSVALCSMEDYDVPENPPDVALPDPDEIPEGSGEFGNLILQIIAGAQLLAGGSLAVAWVLTDMTIVGLAAALLFIGIGVFLFFVVANARLSDRFRAEEYRNRLRAVGVEDSERPDFLPPIEQSAESTGAREHDSPESND